MSFLTKEELKSQISGELWNRLVPFWLKLKDGKNGGFIGYVGPDLVPDPEAEKGCILNSRILWFFSSVCLLCRQEGIKYQTFLEAADHAFDYLKKAMLDRAYGGLLWSVTFDGRPLDTTKHTYNQAFGIYALSAYSEIAAKDRSSEALSIAGQIFDLIEEKCMDEYGYLEAFTRNFGPESNEKLSENGVMAEKTMNTLLHVLEAYTGLLHALKTLPAVETERSLVTKQPPETERSSETEQPPETERSSETEQSPETVRSLEPAVAASLRNALEMYRQHVYNPPRHRSEVFFDRTWHSLIDLTSYGHDIEASWLIDRALEVLDDPEWTALYRSMTADLAESTQQAAFDGRSLAAESECGRVKTERIWWVQAENLVGLLNLRGKTEGAHAEELYEAVCSQWEFIRDCVRDPREGSEWFEEVTPEGIPAKEAPMVQPWKCPYHNGRMCMEAIRRLSR